MLFKTTEERAIFFDQEPSDVEFGSAEEHAGTFNLGMFGSKDELRRDCAKVFVLELIRYTDENDKDWPVSPITDAVECVLVCGSFRAAFESWRVDADFELDQAMSQVIESAPAPVKRNVPPCYAGKVLYDVVLDEMRRAQVNISTTI